MKQRQPLWDQEVHVELTRRAAHPVQDDATWAEYLLLLQACADVISNVPASIGECNALNIEQRLGDDLARLAEAVHEVLPGGFREFSSYLSQAARQEMLILQQRQREKP